MPFRIYSAETRILFFRDSRRLKKLARAGNSPLSVHSRILSDTWERQHLSERPCTPRCQGTRSLHPAAAAALTPPAPIARVANAGMRQRVAYHRSAQDGNFMCVRRPLGLRVNGAFNSCYGLPSGNPQHPWVSGTSSLHCLSACCESHPPGSR